MTSGCGKDWRTCDIGTRNKLKTLTSEHGTGQAFELQAIGKSCMLQSPPGVVVGNAKVVGLGVVVTTAPDLGPQSQPPNSWRTCDVRM